MSSLNNNEFNSNSSLISSTNSRAFDFDGLEESLVDNDLNQSIESLNDLNYDFNDNSMDDSRRPDRRQSSATTTTTTTREQSFHRIRDALIRDSNNRTEEDLELIHNFLSLIVRQNQSNDHKNSSLVNKDFQTRRLLAKHMVLAEIESRDTRVLTHGERLDAYCVVACGSLRHVIDNSLLEEDDTQDDSCVDCVDGECRLESHTQRVRYLSVGDEFGANLDDRVVFGEIFTNEDFVWVLCVPHVVFDEICGEKSFKTVFDEKNEKIIEIRNQFTNELIRATKERLLELLFQSRDDDFEFISDFLLTFRLFWSRERVFNHFWTTEQLLTTIVANLETIDDTCCHEKSLKVVLFWISNHFQDFSKQKLKTIENSLKTKIQKKLFYFTLSSKSRLRHVTLTRSDRAAPLPFALIGGYELCTRLFISDVADDCKDDICRGDRLLSINGVDCHVMEVPRALQLCRASTHLSLQLKFDPSLFHMLLDGQISRNSDSKRLSEVTTTQTSFASLKPIQQLSSQQSSLSSSLNINSNNNWKQKMRQIVQNVTTNTKNSLQNNQNNNQTTGCPPLSPTTTTASETPEIIKIYFESDFRYLPIHATTTARECIQLALIEFQLTSFSSRDFALFEYKLIDATTATTAVKRLSDNFQNLNQNLSLNSRIVLKQVQGQSQGQLSDGDITREISREVRVNSLLTLNKESIARELTLRDFELFCRIESQQFIYDLMTTDDKTTTTTVEDDSRCKELKEFENQTNSELFWTVNRILNESSLEKRVKAIKYLIGVAQECLQLNNFNSFFSILSGLSHQSVQRLKNLWEKVPQKAIKKLEKFYKLMDPSKNFNNFRQQLRHCSPPIIPFFPLVKKDLSFIDLANQTFILGEDNHSVLINWEKMRLLGHKCREVQQMTTQSPQTSTATTPTTTSSTLSSSVAKEAFNQLKALNINSKENNYKQIWEKQRMRKRVQHFLDKSFSEIISDETVLFEKSLQCEPQPQQPSSQSDRQSSIRSSQLSTSSSISSTPSSIAHSSHHLTAGPVMPSPTLSSHSSSPSLSSSTTNSSDIPSQSSRLRFGVRDDTGLRKLLALSDNCVSVSSHNHSISRPLSHSSNVKAFPQTSPQLSSLVPSMPSAVVERLSSASANTQSTAYKPLLPEESSSVTSFRRLEQISRFREQFLPIYNDLSPIQRTGRPSLPSYDQTIQRMKKKFNKNEENIV